MEALQLKSARKVATVTLSFQRELLHKIAWDKQLIGIKGARGVGKTTLLLQAIALKIPSDEQSLYVSLDDLYFQESTLYNMAEEFHLNGGTHLFLDEVHKYPDWSREMKLIYDDFPKLHVVFTSSSILEIFKGEADLSRRAIEYVLPELSLREYIALKHGHHFPIIELNQILADTGEFEKDINDKIKPVKVFHEYMKSGAYPYFIEGEDVYAQRLAQVVNLILEVDLNAVDRLTFDMIVKIKKLLAAIASSVPFTPNVSKLSERTGISRPSLIKALSQLERSRLVHQLFQNGRGIGQLTKPEKLYLNNPNLLHVLAPENWDLGTARETFFVHQLSVSNQLHLAPKGDFIVNEKHLFEVGGKNKTLKQVRNLPDAWLAKDDIEYSVGRSKALWLFGFLY